MKGFYRWPYGRLLPMSTLFDLFVVISRRHDVKPSQSTGMYWCDGSEPQHRPGGRYRQTLPCRQTKEAPSAATQPTDKTPFRPVDRSLFFFPPRFDILVDGYNSLDRNIDSLLSSIPSPWQFLCSCLDTISSFCFLPLLSVESSVLHHKYLAGTVQVYDTSNDR